uniref:YciK family oxidoreductase n=1 Tax=Thaumasiovibrio occultus TaxID=1891184 RepID=UPI000B35DA54|nr:YciK family oxidoreductase [Thaumasiovibrio occultus]
MELQIATDGLKGKIILVTGAGDGIGRTAALTYAKHGAQIILLGRTVAKLEAVYDEILALGGLEPAIIPLDLKGATQKHYQEMADTIEAQFGHLDGLLHNASLLGTLSPFHQIDETVFDDVMQVNVKGAFLMTQPLLPLLKKSAAGRLIFTSSTVGHSGRAYWGSYAISKFATEGMMQIIADEYSNTPLRVNVINPGGTRTQMRASAYPAEDPQTLKTPEEIMPLYLYLMSAQCEETGQCFDAQPK